MSATKIEWTDETWNPVTGCTKVSAGCKNCYAERVFPRTAHGQVVTDPPGSLMHRERRFTDVMFHEDRLRAPLGWRKPRRVFVNSMSDLFHESVTDAQIDRVFAVMAVSGRHSFQVLTKRPERMLAYITRISRSVTPLELVARELGRTLLFKGLDGREHGLLPWPIRSIWLGVSVEDQATADHRIPLLLETPAAVRFVSYEPALGPVDFSAFLPPRRGTCGTDGSACEHSIANSDARIDWIIVGGESGPGARQFDIAWARSVKDQCRAAGVPLFIKQLGGFPTVKYEPGGTTFRLGLRSSKGGDPSEWPDDLVGAREWPRGA